ncbi:alpha/beta-hydrolase [Canariomyces notabilis]|uniref:Kynurenine formamidase n=1 Tax=Canariomyces notabilis TaxID=2074819 RepID=A0AAN6QRM8_9PEZI|nr:alpha/beta-hydrolase [Canariomyces arenarius]
MASVSGTELEADTGAWASVPWTPVTDRDDCNTIIGWRKANIPYLPAGTALSLQTLDVWIPASTTVAAPDASILPCPPNGSAGKWIIYIHGGAWRDPAIDASSFSAAATKLLHFQHTSTNTPITTNNNRKSTGCIAGLASLNYRLSPHPSHPSDDPSRQATHPEHISDVLSALSFLQQHLFHPNNNNNNMDDMILAGHSCGATLAFQAVMAPSRWGLPSPPSPPRLFTRSRVRAIVGLNGLYDLAGVVHSDSTSTPAWLREAYAEFTRGAFGDDEDVWRAVCPATAQGWVPEWLRGNQEGEDGAAGDAGGDDGDGQQPEAKAAEKVVVLVQSRQDSLVPYDQLEKLRGYLLAAAGQGGRLRVEELHAGGEHDDIWREGGRMAEILWQVVAGL